MLKQRECLHLLLKNEQLLRSRRRTVVAVMQVAKTNPEGVPDPVIFYELGQWCMHTIHTGHGSGIQQVSQVLQLVL